MLHLVGLRFIYTDYKYMEDISFAKRLFLKRKYGNERADKYINGKEKMPGDAFKGYKGDSIEKEKALKSNAKKIADRHEDYAPGIEIFWAFAAGMFGGPVSAFASAATIWFLKAQKANDAWATWLVIGVVGMPISNLAAQMLFKWDVNSFALTQSLGKYRTYKLWSDDEEKQRVALKEQRAAARREKRKKEALEEDQKMKPIRDCRVKLEKYSLGELKKTDPKCAKILENIPSWSVRTFAGNYAWDCKEHYDTAFQLMTKGEVGWSSSFDLAAPSNNYKFADNVPSRYKNYRHSIMTYRFPNEGLIRGIVFMKDKKAKAVHVVTCPPISYNGYSNKFGKMSSSGQLDIDDAWQIINRGHFDQYNIR